MLVFSPTFIFICHIKSLFNYSLLIVSNLGFVRAVYLDLSLYYYSATKGKANDMAIENVLKLVMVDKKGALSNFLDYLTSWLHTKKGREHVCALFVSLL